ncbi:hypothetical protein [Nocardiopsis deserti]|uniref:hypothetical protein n=1 Tax=Nocardiopsis deserti TaxID=2605988 RepID=UPI00123B4804|nr:hypothetical protein [Nocardiopsis deserti]
MNGSLVRLVPLAVLLGVAGCGAESDAPPPAAEQTAPPTPTATAQVRMVYTGVTDGRLLGLDYEVTAELGEPISGAGCELAAPAGTVTVPVTVRLVNTHDPDAAAAADGGEPVRWSTPRYLTAEPVGADGPLRWAPERAGHPCTDQPDLASFVSLGWEHREQATFTGYLTGVPESDRDGVGVRLEFVRELWEVHQGEPEPLTVTY